MDLFFVDCCSTAKTTKIGSLENFWLYGKVCKCKWGYRLLKEEGYVTRNMDMHIGVQIADVTNHYLL